MHHSQNQSWRSMLKKYLWERSREGIDHGNTFFEQTLNLHFLDKRRSTEFVDSRQYFPNQTG
jgi:hypothetical protein